MKIYRSFLAALIVFIGFSINVKAQKDYVKLAEDAFKRYEYYDAIPMYKKAYSKTKSSNRVVKTKLLFQIAECYRLTNQPENAAKWYDRAINKNYKDPIVYMYYADMLRKLQKWDDAIVQYKLYEEKAPKDQRGKIGEQSCELAKKWKDTPTRYKVKEMKVFNSRQSDFAPAFIDQKRFNSIVFTSDRQESTGKGTDAWTGHSFSDIYISRKDRKGAWSSPVSIGKPINTDLAEGAACLNRKATEMYFTRCNQEKKKKTTCQIFTTQLVGNDWTEPKSLPLAPDSVTVGDPFISDDELSLYFSSDLPGGYGGHDLWVVKRKSKSDAWAKPENLGPNINTAGDERFPFIRPNGDLYFASDGRVGMGGLDIYKAPKKDNGWGEPVNMLAPINSGEDDFAIVFQGNEERGFFSSNRNIKTSDDIYMFWLPNLLFTLRGTVRDDSTKKPIPEALVKVTDSDGKTFQGKTDINGLYKFDTTQILPNKTYYLVFSKEPLYFSAKGQTTTVGYEESKDLVLDKNLVPIPKKPIVLPDILYDLDKWALKPEFQDSLNGLYQTLIDNPKIVIELSSHTDPRASEQHNDTLSQRRAQSVVDYLIKKGVDPERLVAKGYGKRVPRLIKANKSIVINGQKFTFTKGTELSEKYISTITDPNRKEAAWYLDRRTEFRVLNQNFVPKPKPEGEINKPEGENAAPAVPTEDNGKKDNQLKETVPPVNQDSVKTPVSPVNKTPGKK